ncbi:MAG: hypothetical protein HOP30_08230 [Cyclobacteriaceae bacterium]|nr:hypothetical protein [Cyclobacteriaceae bacterium]
MELVILKRFSSSEDAKELTDILSQNAIQFHVVEDKESLDALYGDKNFTQQYFVKIKSEDFDRANNILQQLGERASHDVGKDHYLYSFTDEELFDLISKQDEWSEMDFHLAKKILTERGKEINDSTIQLLKQHRLATLSKPDETPKAWIYGGYLFAFAGGFLGILIGYSFWTSKKIIPNGTKVPMYSNEVRMHGFRIMIIGIIMFFIVLAIRFLTTDF